MTPSPASVSNQIAWARGKAAQHGRIAQRYRPGSPAQDKALRDQQIAAAVARSLERLKEAR